jgi:hypothetical protein
VVVVFLEGRPAYRGSFIAKLTRRAVRRLLPEPEAEKKPAEKRGRSFVFPLWLRRSRAGDVSPS